MCAGGGTQLSASSCHCPALRGVLHVTIKAQMVFVVSSCKRHCNIKHSNIYKNVYKNQQGVAEPKKLCTSSLFVSLQELAALQTVSGSVSTTCGTHSCTVLHISIKKKNNQKTKRPSAQSWSSCSAIRQTTGEQAHCKHTSLLQSRGQKEAGGGYSYA